MPPLFGRHPAASRTYKPYPESAARAPAIGATRRVLFHIGFVNGRAVHDTEPSVAPDWRCVPKRLIEHGF